MHLKTGKVESNDTLNGNGTDDQTEDMFENGSSCEKAASKEEAIEILLAVIKDGSVI